MKYQVIARKFRPQLFTEVVGQNPIVQTLQNAIQLNRIGHAYLFSGPRGVGKTTTARILAKGLNCAQGPTATPCNVCASCKEIAAAQALDVLEIDAASNTGVDNIRELRENARYAPSRDRYKIFIIDEVHMLSTSAFNALLKILEEPPPHVVFIMATTERHKLPATILSRCQQFVFRSISPADIQAHLREIADRENAKIDDEGLSYIVKAAEGSMRDAQSLLDQIISFGGQEIAHEDVRDVLGFIPKEILDRTIDAIADHDSKALLECAEIVVNQGLSLQQYVRECIACMRDLLMMKLGLGEKVLGGADEKAALAGRAKRFSEQDLIRYFDLLLRLENDMRWTSQPRLHMEVGLVKLAKAGHIRDIEDVIRDFKQGSSATAGPTPGPAPRTTAPMPPPAPRTTEPARRIQPEPEAKPAPAAAPKPSPAPPPKPVEGGSLAEEFLRRVEEKSVTTGTLLQKAKRVEQKDNQLRVIMLDSTGLALLDSTDHKSVLNAAAGELIGKGATVSLIIEEQRAASVPDARRDSGNTVQSAKDEPLVKRFLEVFRGDIAQIKPVNGE
jgi:DNA polymerase-3 subunit gamma/tau